MARPLAMALTAAVLGCACGPDLIPDAELREVCGQEGRVQVLEAQDDRWLASVRTVEVGSETRLIVETADARPLFGGDPDPDLVDRELWSVGECGESPELIAQGLRSNSSGPQPADYVIACSQDLSELYAVDPAGVHAPVLLFPEVRGCSQDWTDHGKVQVHESAPGQGSLTLWRLPEDPWESEPTIVDLIESPNALVLDTGIGDLRRPVTLVDEVLALRTDGALVRIGLPQNQTTVIEDNVVAFDASVDFIVWQSGEITGGTAEQPEGPIHVLDRTTGARVYLEDGDLQRSTRPADTWSGGVVLSKPDGAQHLFHRLPATDFVAVEGPARFGSRVGETRWIISSGTFGEVTWFEDFETGERLPLSNGWFHQIDYDPEADHLDILEVPVCCADRDSFRHEGPVSRIDFDGERTLLAQRATLYPKRLPDGRLTTRVEVDGSDRGKLIGIEPATREERLIDSKVGRHPWLFSRWRNDVFYWARDGERTGLWRARLADRE